MPYETRIPEIIKQLEAEAKKAVDTTGEELAQRAKQRAPVRTGRLRDSIHYKGDGVVAATAPYAAYVEYGTHDAAAHPFMTPATEEERVKFPKRVSDAVRRAVD